MKKFVYLIIILFVTLTGAAQEECISCFYNDINFDKYASAIGNYNISLGLNSLASGEGNSVKGNYASASFVTGRFVDLLHFQTGTYVFSLFDKDDRLIESKKVIKE